MIPLITRLRKAVHREVAKAQDLIVEAIFETFDDAVLHGGTSLWRCYQGNRFSEDVDVYLPRDLERITLLFEKLKKKGLTIEKKKIGEKSIYSTLQMNRVEVRFEAVFKKVKGTLKEYETVEGNYLTVYTLTAEELIEEKINAYLQRRKIRDLYDLFFLLRYVQDREKLRLKLRQLLSQFPPPADEKDLKVLILEGLVPTSLQMKEYLKRF